jgi:formylglycine-generating enzyme required for sulfatase activity
MTDLKPSNLLITRQGRLVIGDLGGLKRIATVSTTSSAQFSPNWSAPDLIVRGERPRLPAVVYAFGLVAFFLLEGRLPHAEESFMERIRRLRAEGPDFGRGDAPPPLQLLIRQCLAFDPDARPADFRRVLERLAPFRGAAAPTPAPPPPAVQGFAPRRAPPPLRPRPAAARDWIEPITGMPFVAVPAGRLVRAAAAKSAESATGGAAMAIAPFWIGKYPVTQAQWQKIMGGNPSRFQGEEHLPVEQVTWHEAAAFAERLGRLNRGRFRFALPTEAQWEYACRGGDLSAAIEAGDSLEAAGWYAANSPLGPRPVGQLRPNRLGICDMLGNVAEWCADLYQPAAGSEDSEELSTLKRVGRGGGWSDPAERCTPFSRRGYPAGLRYAAVGVRLVRLPEP